MNKTLFMFLGGWPSLFIILWGSVLLELDAQEPPSSSARALRFYQQGMENLKARHFDDAILALENAIRRDKNFIEAYLALSSVYELLLDPEKELSYLLQAFKVDSTHVKNRRTYYKLGKAYLQQGKYQEALPMFENYLEHENLDESEAVGVRKEISRIRFSQASLQKALLIEPRPLPIPKGPYALNYFPSLTLDGKTLLFTGRKNKAAHADEDILISYKEEGSWSMPIPLPGKVNTSKNEGSCVISPTGDFLILSACQRSDSFGSCDLYLSRKDRGVWQFPVNMGKTINSSAWDSQPSLSADGRNLYFVSDRPGGQGKRDIWTSRRTKKGWSTPQNLGPRLNTPEDEVSPFIHSNGESLYFSSEGHLGMGGFDLFLSEKDPSGAWGKPRNLGAPLNTYQDELSLVVDIHGIKGYYTQEGKRTTEFESRIYHVDLPVQIRVRRATFLIQGRVRNALSQEPLAVRLSFQGLKSDPSEYLFTSDASGKYLSVLLGGSPYRVQIQEAGFLLYQKQIRLDKDRTEDINLIPIPPPEIIFFPTNGYLLTQVDKGKLERLGAFLQDHPQARLNISGHTDNTGSSAFNQLLSEKRASAAHAVLLQMGIDSQRMTWAGYAQNKPYQKAISSKAKDPSELRRLNRRTEVEIRSVQAPSAAD
ncbi:MAG: OmpA family protein [Cytophagales bacterium]|nr:OmpA family protein [Cytophagales bacterium]